MTRWRRRRSWIGLTPEDWSGDETDIVKGLLAATTEAKAEYRPQTPQRARSSVAEMKTLRSTFSPKSGASIPVSEMTCYRCEGKGHIAAQCRHPDGRCWGEDMASRQW